MALWGAFKLLENYFILVFFTISAQWIFHSDVFILNYALKVETSAAFSKYFHCCQQYF
jgi:hypothetical protein